MRHMSPLIALLLLAVPLQAQFVPGNVEASLSAGLQSIAGAGASSTNIMLSTRVGFFPVEQFEVEPEFMIVKGENVTAMYMLNGNLAYNFKLPTGTASPFVLAGYGITNSFPIFNLLFQNYDTTIGVLNLGIGLKILVAKNVAVRIEYRYQKFTGEKTSTLFGYTSTMNVDLTNHTVNVGFSVIL